VGRISPSDAAVHFKGSVPQFLRGCGRRNIRVVAAGYYAAIGA
jgi:hypothetical protein